MRILAVARPNIGEGGTYRVYKSLSYYPSKDIEVYTVIPYGGLQHINDKVIEDLRSRGVKFVGTSSLRFWRPRVIVNILSTRLPQLMIKLRYERISDPDIVVSFHESYDALYTAHKLAMKLDRKSVAFIHSPIYLSRRRWENLWRAHMLWYASVYGFSSSLVTSMYIDIVIKRLYEEIQKLAKSFDHLIGITKATCVEMEGFPKPLYCIDRGVTFDDEDLKLIEMIRSSVKHKENWIAFTGRPVATKGVVEAIQVFKEILKHFPDMKLYITGRAPSTKVESGLKRFVKRLDIEDKVIFTGLISKDKTLEIVAKAKLLLHPSHMDAFSYAIAEALYLGTPVVTYDIPATRIHYGGLEGVGLVPEGDVEAMAAEALDMLNREKVCVEKPKLRSWSDILEEEVGLLFKAMG